MVGRVFRKCKQEIIRQTDVTTSLNLNHLKINFKR